MTALSERAWPLGAARKGVLLACILAGFFLKADGQNTQATAVPPSFAVQPLYGELLSDTPILAAACIRQEETWLNYKGPSNRRV
jgi:hypothetical protein